MLETLGLASSQELFDSIPRSIRDAFRGDGLPETGLSEDEVSRELNRLAARNLGACRFVSFLGGGVYDHYVPSLISSLILRSEFLTAYTPYQPEVSQGTLQAIFEFQSLICNLTGMAVANASLYDGATAIAEAALLACGATNRDRVLVSAGVNPRYRAVVSTYLEATDRELTLVDVDGAGRTPVAAVGGNDVAAVVVAYPNFFGIVEELAALRQAMDRKALLIVVANPIALGLLAAPGALGADLVVGEGMSLGVGQNFGGPGVGFIAVKEALLRRIPGRLVGMARDHDGRPGFVLTLQAREQHIRRARASSNICSNQALAALAATIYLSTLGKRGLPELARLNYHKAHYAFRALTAIPGVKAAFDGPFFNEFAVRLPASPASILPELQSRDGLAAGLALGPDYPALGDALLVAVTERRSRADIDALAAALARVLRS
jgi:glycine dehydrogenase subunit 1